MIKWHRATFRDDQGVPYLSYINDHRDWAAWSIDRLQQSNGSRTFWFEYQVRYHGDPIGTLQRTLREAKELVLNTGRES